MLRYQKASFLLCLVLERQIFKQCNNFFNEVSKIRVEKECWSNTNVRRKNSGIGTFSLTRLSYLSVRRFSLGHKLNESRIKVFFVVSCTRYTECPACQKVSSNWFKFLGWTFWTRYLHLIILTFLLSLKENEKISSPRYCRSHGKFSCGISVLAQCFPNSASLV